MIEQADDVGAYESRRLGIVCQTTMTERRVAELREIISERNPDAEIRFVDTVCLPTKEHQRALERLIETVDAIVVVGGRNSNNTLELVTRCRQRGRPAPPRAVGRRSRGGLVPWLRPRRIDSGHFNADGYS